MTHAFPRRVALAARAVLAAGLLASCGSDSVCICEPLPRITLDPASLDVAAGDSARLTVTATGAGGPARIRLVSGQPAVARVDSVAQSGVPTTVRAGVVGSTVLTVTVVQGGETATGSVPVTVRARP